MTYRNKKLTDLAHETPCMAQFPHECTGRFPGEDGKTYTTVPAHSNWLRWGRGHGHRSPDLFHAAVCPPAHDFIDGRRGNWKKEEREAEWERAFIATFRHYFEKGLIRVA